MDQLKTLLGEALCETLSAFIISKPSGRAAADNKDGIFLPLLNGSPIQKIRIRPLLSSRGELIFQAEESSAAQVRHRNMTKPETEAYVTELIPDFFLQAQIECDTLSGTVLANRKGTVTVKIRRKQDADRHSGDKPARIRSGADRPAESGSSGNQPASGKREVFGAKSLSAQSRLEHNRRKHYILEEGMQIPFLQKLGVMTADGRVVRARYDKFRQINRFLEFIDDVLPELPSDRPIRILDFGCGKSYLTFAIYYYLHELKKRPVQITGLDLKADVIEDCSELAEECGYGDLEFLCGDIADYEGCSTVDMVVTLHACDTATDYALKKAVDWGASVILSVPCCQHELNRQIRNDLLSPVLSYGILKERMSALLTDGIRANLLEEQGYSVQLLEFIDMEHTPKNILIRAVKKNTAGKENPKMRQLIRELHADLTLDKLLENPELSEEAHYGPSFFS